MKYLVISYDSDEQQWFYDHVIADSEEQAEEKICTLRDYVIAADAISITELSTMVGRLAAHTPDEISYSLDQLKNMLTAAERTQVARKGGE